MLGSLQIAGGPGTDATALVDRYARALHAGTTPGHAEAWPAIGHHDQALVEATAIAVSLHWSRAWLWDRLPEVVRQQLVDWLSGARGRWCADNNHVLFGATVQSFLASVGADYDRVAVDGALDRIDDWYAGDGWYSDGVGRRFDHYNAWTFHLYPFFIEQLLEGLPASSRGTTSAFDVYRNRLRMFLDDYQHLFDSTGTPVLQGRSLIYRWGVVAPFWMGALQGVSPLSPGRVRRLASGTLAGFVEAGALDTGVLDLGWTRPSSDLLQSYNAPGSPLWASKGFLGLLLPQDHPVWREVEEPVIAEQSDFVRPMSGPRWVAVGRRSDGSVRVLNHGSDGHPRRADPLYRRLAYSTATVPVHVNGLEDNSITVGEDDAPSVHRGLVAGSVHRESAASRFRVDAAGRDVVVDVGTVAIGDYEVRVARLRGVLEQRVRCTGWAVSADAPVLAHHEATWAEVTDADGRSSVVASLAAPADRQPTVGAESIAHRHALGGQVGLPWLETDAESEGTLQIAWLVYLGRRWDPALLECIRVDWVDDGALIDVDGVVRHCAWARGPMWRADALNQGIFRVGSAPLSP